VTGKRLDIVPEGARTVRGVVTDLRLKCTKHDCERGRGCELMASVQLTLEGGTQQGSWFTAFGDPLVRSFCEHLIGREITLVVETIQGKNGALYEKIVSLTGWPELHTRQEWTLDQQRAASIEAMFRDTFDLGP
jgi:hypothetical protein